MDPDKKLEQEFAEYATLAKENKNIDVNALMINALQNQTQNKNLVSAKAKKWAYLVSIGAPPLGLFFALKLYFSTEEDASHVANTCIALTIVGIAMFWAFGKLVFSGTGSSLSQIEQITPQDIHESVQ